MVLLQTGTLLIAEPFLKDPNFRRAVIFLCNHQKQGSFGLVINKSLQIPLSKVIEDVTEDQVFLCYGGPVQMDTLHFLHNLPDCIPGGEKVGEGIYWGGDMDLVIKQINNKSLDLTKIRFYLGYSGWGEGQLVSEWKENKSWLTIKAKEHLIFHPNLNELWGDAISELGADFKQMKNYPIDPQLN
jgi:putative transcriptional regulator